jgi:hypothetical protein
VHLAEREGDKGGKQGQQDRAGHQDQGGDGEQAAADRAYRRGRAEQAVYPLEHVRAGRRQARRRARRGGGREDRQGGGQRGGSAFPGGYVVGVQLDQGRYLLVGIPEQREERSRATGDPGQGLQQLMMRAQMRALVRDDGG